MTITNRVSLKSVMAGNTPVPDVVDAPTIGTATAGVESATVTFTAATTGGAATTFGAISTPGSVTGTSATSPITVSGLTGGTAYTFKTYGINSSGTWSNVLSVASNSVTPTVPNSFESIATVTVGGGGSANVEFTSIPNTYTHLQIRGIGRGSFTDLTMRFNSDTGNNYSSHRFYGEGSTGGADGEFSSGSYGTFILYAGRLNSAASVFCANIIDILDYANTNKYKTSRSFYGFEDNSSGNIFLTSGSWRNTNAITTIRLTPNSGTISQYSQFALYGIKGA